MLDGSWLLTTYKSAVNWLFVGQGKCVMDAPYDWRSMHNRTCAAHGCRTKGRSDLSVEEFGLDSKKRAAYPDYGASAAAVLREFEEYRDTCFPALPDEFEKSRDAAAWMIWSHTRTPAPRSLIKRDMVIMMHQLFGQCYCWQQAFRPWLIANADFAWAFSSQYLTIRIR